MICRLCVELVEVVQGGNQFFDIVFQFFVWVVDVEMQKVVVFRIIGIIWYNCYFLFGDQCLLQCVIVNVEWVQVDLCQVGGFWWLLVECGEGVVECVGDIVYICLQVVVQGIESGSFVVVGGDMGDQCWYGRGREFVVIFQCLQVVVVFVFFGYKVVGFGKGWNIEVF